MIAAKIKGVCLGDLSDSGQDLGGVFRRFE